MDDEQLSEWDGYLAAPFTLAEIEAEETRQQAIEDAEREIEDRNPVEIDGSDLPDEVLRTLAYWRQQQEAHDAGVRERLRAGTNPEPQE